MEAISVGRPEIPVGTGQPALTEAPGQMNEGLVEGSSPRVSSLRRSSLCYGVRVFLAAFEFHLRRSSLCSGVQFSFTAFRLHF